MVVGNAFRAFLRESGVAGGTSFEEAAAPARASLERRLARIARTSTVVLVVVVAIEIALLVAAAVLVVVAPDRGEALQKVGAANLFNLPVALGVLGQL